MGNCLVTKLKGTVDNIELVPMGYLRVKAPTNRNMFNCVFSFSQPAVIKIIGGTYNGNTSINIPTDYNFNGNPFISDGTFDGYVYVDIPKYTLVSMAGLMGTLNIGDLLYSDDLINLDCSNCTIKGADSASKLLPRLKTINFSNSIGEVVDITNLGIDGNLKSFALGGLYQKGDLSNIGFSALEIESWAGAFPITENVSFSIERFVTNNRNAGRTSGQQNSFHWMGLCNSTFNGVRLEHKSNYAISWTADTITVDGVTINA